MVAVFWDKMYLDNADYQKISFLGITQWKPKKGLNGLQKIGTTSWR
jgi:hypothetical protein